MFDNSDLAHPFRKVAEFENGKPVELSSGVAEVGAVEDTAREALRRSADAHCKTEGRS